MPRSLLPRGNPMTVCGWSVSSNAHQNWRLRLLRILTGRIMPPIICSSDLAAWESGSCRRSLKLRGPRSRACGFQLKRCTSEALALMERRLLGTQQGRGSRHEVGSEGEGVQTHPGPTLLFGTGLAGSYPYAWRQLGVFHNGASVCPEHKPWPPRRGGNPNSMQVSRSNLARTELQALSSRRSRRWVGPCKSQEQSENKETVWLFSTAARNSHKIHLCDHQRGHPLNLFTRGVIRWEEVHAP